MEEHEKNTEEKVGRIAESATEAVNATLAIAKREHLSMDEFDKMLGIMRVLFCVCIEDAGGVSGCRETF